MRQYKPCTEKKLSSVPRVMAADSSRSRGPTAVEGDLWRLWGFSRITF